MQRDIAAALCDPALPGPGGRHFAVHRNNVVAGLVAALAAAYPAVRALVGPAFFAAAAALHVRAHPPRSPVMLHYGADFPDWIARFAPAAGLAYLADVALLERAWGAAFHAGEAVPDSGARLACLAPDRLGAVRFRLHPSLCLVVSPHPIVSLWADATGRPGGRVDLGRAETAVIARPGAEVGVRVAAPGEAAFLQAMIAGARFDALAGQAAAGAFDLGAELRRAFDHGLIAAIDETQTEAETADA